MKSINKRPVKPIQFDWRRHWKKKVEPHLKKEEVQHALDIGMLMLTQTWRRGDPPYIHGGIDGRRVVDGKLAWYQPLGRCHWIAFFSMAIGVLNYPKLDWRFMSGDLHTVPVGFDSNGHPKVVMDILLFDQMSAEESLARTQMKAACEATDEIGAAQFNVLYALFIEHRVPLIRALVGRSTLKCG